MIGVDRKEAVDVDVGHCLMPEHETGVPNVGILNACRNDPDVGHSLTSGLETDGCQMGGGAASDGRRGPDGHGLITGDEFDCRKLSGDMMSKKEKRSGTDGHCHTLEEEPDVRQMGDDTESDKPENSDEPEYDRHKSDDGKDCLRKKLMHAFDEPDGDRVGSTSHDCWDPGGITFLSCPPSA